MVNEEGEANAIVDLLLSIAYWQTAIDNLKSKSQGFVKPGAWLFDRMAVAGLQFAGRPERARVSFRWRLTLALLGLALALVSAAAIVYVAWPMRSQREDFQPAPTLFAPPAAMVGGWSTE